MLKQLVVIVAMMPTVSLSMLLPSARHLARVAAPLIAQQKHTSQAVCSGLHRWNHHATHEREVSSDANILDYYRAFDAAKDDAVDVAALEQQAKKYAQKEREWRRSKQDFECTKNAMLCEVVGGVGKFFGYTAPLAVVEGICAAVSGFSSDYSYFFIPLCAGVTGLATFVSVPFLTWAAVAHGAAKVSVRMEEKHKKKHADAVRILERVKAMQETITRLSERD